MPVVSTPPGHPECPLATRLAVVYYDDLVDALSRATSKFGTHDVAAFVTYDAAAMTVDITAHTRANVADALVPELADPGDVLRVGLTLASPPASSEQRWVYAGSDRDGGLLLVTVPAPQAKA